MKYFSTEQTYSKIYVCEALQDDEPSTGMKLARDTLKLLCDMKEICMDARKVSDKGQFMAFMNRVELQTREKGVFPIIHLEIHGDKSGLSLPSKEGIKWDEFSDICRAINVHCSNNLLVVLAVCHGYHSVLQATITKLTPFCSLIGPTETVDNMQIEKDFPKFYKTLFNSKNLDLAFSTFSEPYQLYRCEKLFADGLVEYINKHCRGRGRQERVEELLTKVKQSPSGRNLSTGDARKLIKELIKPDIDKLDIYRTKFLMADDPKNKGRFTATVDELIKLAYAKVSVNDHAMRRRARRGLTTLENAKKMIVIDPNVLAGTPCFKGTRLPIHDIAGMVANGDKISTILAAYPTLTEEQVDAAIVYAQAYPRGSRLRSMPDWQKKEPLASSEFALDALSRSS